MEVRSVGDGAAMVEVAGPEQALALALWLRARVAAVDVVPAACTVLVDGCPPERVREALAGWDGQVRGGTGPLVEVPVVYDGPDLAGLADRLGIGVDELVRRHTQAEHVSAFCGFAPGFAYLTGSPWEVPRLDSPRPRVEPGSVGLAGPYTGIYPTASPGGWQLVGRTNVRLWDAARDEPALLAPGTRVRFVAA